MSVFDTVFGYKSPNQPGSPVVEQIMKPVIRTLGNVVSAADVQRNYDPTIPVPPPAPPPVVANPPAPMQGIGTAPNMQPQPAGYTDK